MPNFIDGPYRLPDEISTAIRDDGGYESESRHPESFFIAGIETGNSKPVCRLVIENHAMQIRRGKMIKPEAAIMTKPVSPSAQAKAGSNLQRASASSIEVLDHALRSTQHWLDDAVSPYAVAARRSLSQKDGNPA